MKNRCWGTFLRSSPTTGVNFLESAVKQNTEKDAPLYSPRDGPSVNVPPIDERALDSAYLHRKNLRGFLSLERRVLRAKAAARPKKPPPVPTRLESQFEAVLAAVLAAYPPGSRVGRAAIVDASGCNDRFAADVRALARTQGRWPYEDAGGFGKKGDGR